MTRNRPQRAVKSSRTRAREGMDVWATLLAMPLFEFLLWYAGTLFMVIVFFAVHIAVGILALAVQSFIFGKALLWR